MFSNKAFFYIIRITTILDNTLNDLSKRSTNNDGVIINVSNL